MQKKKSPRRRAAMLAFFLLSLSVIAVTLISEVRKGGAEALLWRNLQVNVWYMLGALGCFLLALAIETYKYYILLRASGVDHLRLAHETAVFGRYYDCITPSGVGGQPYQIMHLSQHGVETSTGSAIVMAGFLSMQLGFVIVSVLSIIFGLGYIGQSGIQIATFFGLVCYMLVPGLIIAVTFRPKLAASLVTFTVKVLSRLHLVKDRDAFMEKAQDVMVRYEDGFRYLFHRRTLFRFTLLLGVLYHLCICSLPFFVIHAFGGDISWLTAFTTTVIIYTAITFIPTPGNSGAAEGSFYLVFSTLADVSAFWPMMLWRIFSYYSFIVAGLALYTFDFFRRKTHKHRDEDMPSPTRNDEAQPPNG